MGYFVVLTTEHLCSFCNLVLLDFGAGIVGLSEILSDAQRGIRR